MESSGAADPFLAVAIRAARTAASILVDAARDLARLPTFSKDHAHVVSGADMEAEDAIVAAIRSAFPDHAILGEESGHIAGAREGSGYRWLVDPLDGSANFIHGYPAYAVSIALVHGTEITHAVVLDPIRDDLFAATRGEGATCNDVALRMSTCTDLGRALVGTLAPSREHPGLDAYLPTLTALTRACGGVRQTGTCALSLAHLAAGRLDGFWMTGLRPWDIAAGALIVREAGGRIGDFAGGSQFLRTGEVIASVPGIFAALRQAIATTDRSPPT